MPVAPTMTFALVNLAWQRDDREAEEDLLRKLQEWSQVILAIETVDSPMKRMLRKWKTWRPARTEGSRNNTVAVAPSVRTGFRGTVVAVEPGRARMRTRWLAWRKVWLEDRGLRAGAAHRPPFRYRWLWAAFDDAVARWLLSKDSPAVLGLDANAPQLPRITRETGYRWVHVGIMGLLVAPELEVLSLETIRHRASDHPILLLTVRWRTKRT